MAVNNNLKITYINVNSLVSNNRRFELLQFLNLHKPDVCLLGETKLNASHNLSYKDYTLVRNDRKNATFGGSTAILIKCSISFE